MSNNDVKPLHANNCYYLAQRDEIVTEARELCKQLSVCDDKLNNLEFQIAKVNMDLEFLKSAVGEILRRLATVDFEIK